MTQNPAALKQITVPFLKLNGEDCFLQVDKFSAPQYVDQVLWSSPRFIPKVVFYIAYTDEAIILKYTVTEPFVKAEYLRINDPVYKDSCVEFFIGFENENRYYNFEFNRLGTVLGAFGSNRHDRQSLAASALSKIRSRHSLQHDGKTGLYTWQLTLALPFSVFGNHQITDLKGKIARCNFFKCGDDLPDLHFMSWSPVLHPEPDFHQSQYFGILKFQTP